MKTVFFKLIKLFNNIFKKVFCQPKINSNPLKLVNIFNEKKNAYPKCVIHVRNTNTFLEIGLDSILNNNGILEDLSQEDVSSLFKYKMINYPDNNYYKLLSISYDYFTVIRNEDNVEVSIFFNDDEQIKSMIKFLPKEDVFKISYHMAISELSTKKNFDKNQEQKIGYLKDGENLYRIINKSSNKNSGKK